MKNPHPYPFRQPSGFKILLAKLFGKKTIKIDRAQVAGDCSVKSTVYFYKGNYYLTNLEFIENKDEPTTELRLHSYSKKLPKPEENANEKRTT